MPETPPEPTSERPEDEAALLAAAATGQLDARDAAAYDALVAADPSVASEVAELRGLLERVGQVGSWQEPEPSEELAARVLATPRTETAAAPAPHDLAGRRRRWVLPGMAAAAALVVLGGFAGVAVQDWREQPPEGPPGTLGAVEAIDFEGEPPGVDIEASLIAHTWGTETVLAMDGWAPGERFDVVLVGDDGEVEGSGSFLGSQVPVLCRLNGSLLREDVDVVEIRDERGRVVASSDVPAVES